MTKKWDLNDIPIKSNVVPIDGIQEKPPLNEKQKELLEKKAKMIAEVDKEIEEAGGGGEGEVDVLAYKVLLLTHEINKNLGLYKKRWVLMQRLMEMTERREFTFGPLSLRINDQFADTYNQVFKRSVVTRWEPEVLGNTDVLDKEID
jgi:hypothetical protein